MKRQPKEPVEQVKPHIWKDADGKFWYSDETEDFGGGPYVNQKQAEDSLANYVEWLEHGR